MKQNGAKLRLLCRLLVYLLGLFLLAMGVAISINSNLGVSPVSSLPYIFSLILNLPMSLCIAGVFAVYILLQALILRRAFRPVSLVQIVFSFVFGYFTDLAKWIIGDFAIPTYAGRLAMLAVSVVLIAIGVHLYVSVKLLPMPMEGLSLAISSKTGLPFHNTKMIIDCLVVGVAIALSFLFLGGLSGIREGTVITAVVVGRVIGLIRRPLAPLLRRLCPETPVESIQSTEPEPLPDAKPAE